MKTLRCKHYTMLSVLLISGLIFAGCIYSYQTDNQFVQNYFFVSIYIGSSISTFISLIKTIETFPYSRYSLKELVERESLYNFYIPKEIVSKIYKNQGFLYSWQVQDYEIDRAAVKAAKKYRCLHKG